jgi:hypothetical protein
VSDPNDPNDHSADAMQYVLTATQLQEQRSRMMEKTLRHAMMYGQAVAGVTGAQISGTITGRVSPQQVNAQQVQAKWVGSIPSMQATFDAHRHRQRVRSMLLDEFNRIIASIKAPEHARLRGIFTTWWNTYRQGTINVYSEDEETQTRRVAEVRIGFARCIEAAREREKLAAARKAKREHDHATYGKQHR